MRSQLHSGCRYGKPMLASIALSGLVLFLSVSQAVTAQSAINEAQSAVVSPDSEVSIWVNAAPLGLVINQLAHLSGKSAEIEGLGETPVSGRFSGSLDSVLAKLSADYPVIFDLDGETVHAMSSDARKSASIPMLSTNLDETFKHDLLAAAGSGNQVEIRDDEVRITGHPAFVKRQSRAVATAEARFRAGAVVATESAPADATTIADSGSAEVLVDIQDEVKPPADQANLSRPIRWVTDIPGFNTF